MSRPAEEDGRRRTRRLAVVGLMLVLVALLTWLLWRELAGWTLRVGLDEEVDTFPQPPDLTVVVDERPGTGAPFFGERPWWRRVYASDVDATRTCELVRGALEAWQVDARPVPADEPGHVCDLAGSRGGPPGGARTHVRVTVLTADEWVRRSAPSAGRAAGEPPAEAVVIMQLTRSGADVRIGARGPD